MGVMLKEGSGVIRADDQPLLRFHLSRAFTRNAQRWYATLVLLGLLLPYMYTRPQLIEITQVNQARICDVVERASTVPACR